MKHDISIECLVYDSFRVKQVTGMFDLQPASKATKSWSVELPELSEDWTIGCIVGPSGSGKTTVARHVCGDWLYADGEWPGDRAVIDCFPEQLDTKTIVKTLTSVGFSSPPGWIKPYSVLSNGEKFRCDLARALLSDGDVIAYDEFTSVVDRTVAKVGSAAIAKAIRKGGISKRFVAVTCHYDILEWLEPDWVLDMGAPNANGELGQLSRRRLRRPQIDVEVVRCTHKAWQLFKGHHYLSGDVNKAALTFVGVIDGHAAAYSSWLPFLGRRRSRKKAYRGHRFVVLPDFQGIGIGSKLTDFCASALSGVGYEAIFNAAHPAIISAFSRSKLWRISRMPSRTALDSSTSANNRARKTRASDRLTAGFVYVGPAMDADEARRLIYT